MTGCPSNAIHKHDAPVKVRRLHSYHPQKHGALVKLSNNLLEVMKVMTVMKTRCCTQKHPVQSGLVQDTSNLHQSGLYCEQTGKASIPCGHHSVEQPMHLPSITQRCGFADALHCMSIIAVEILSGCHLGEAGVVAAITTATMYNGSCKRVERGLVTGQQDILGTERSHVKRSWIADARSTLCSISVVLHQQTQGISQTGVELAKTACRSRRYKFCAVECMCLPFSASVQSMCQLW